jgi:muramoyltetrapeptide carboxypeptidase
VIRPPRMRPGDAVALIAPAGPVTAERIDAAVARCLALGLRPVLGQSVRERNGYLAGHDDQRRADFQTAIDDDDIRALWALRGGYGTMRILPQLPLERMRTRPQAFIGFSDNTAIHLALARQGVVSFHAPHAGADSFPDTSERCFRQVLFETAPAGLLPAAAAGPTPVALRGGSVDGVLAGGNLALLAACCGTPYALRGAGVILLIEEIGEPLYRIDRMLVQLSLAGCLDGVVGLAVGRITELQDEGPGLQELIASWANALRLPAVLDLPFGHVAENWTLPLGVRARLDASAGTLEVLEPAVS